MNKYHFVTQPKSRLLSAVATLHTNPISLEMVLVDADRTLKIRCTNPLPLRSLGSLSEGIDRICVEDRNATGASLEFGRFNVEFFVGEEMTERIDCDICDIEPVLIQSSS
jgi:hypothetical protein